MPDRFTEYNVVPYFPICNECKHHFSGDKCLAFLKGIPREILNGDHDHHKPFAGDNGIQFEPKEY